MTPAGYSGTPLPRKLGMKAGHRVATLAAPDDFEALLADLPAGVALEADPPVPEGEPVRTHDVVVAFARDRGELEDGFARGRRLLAWDGGLWIAWPKRTSSLAGELREGDVRAHGLDEGLVDNKICAVDEDWSGLRFVYRREDRPSRRR